MDTGKAITNTEMMTIRASTTTGTVTATFADGMTSTKVICLQDLRRKTDCPRGWKDSLCGVGNFRQDSRNASNRVRRTSSGGYLRPLRIAST